MAIKIYENGAFRDATLVRDYKNGAWQDADFVRAYETNAWVDKWSTKPKIDRIDLELGGYSTSSYINEYDSETDYFFVNVMDDDNDWIQFTINFYSGNVRVNLLFNMTIRTYQELDVFTSQVYAKTTTGSIVNYQMPSKTQGSVTYNNVKANCIFFDDLTYNSYVDFSVAINVIDPEYTIPDRGISVNINHSGYLSL